MLQGAKLPVGRACCFRLCSADQTEVRCGFQQRQIAGIRGQFVVVAGMAQYQVLHHELDVHDAAAAALEAGHAGLLPDLDDDQAFQMLSKVSQEMNIKVAEVAKAADGVIVGSAIVKVIQTHGGTPSAQAELAAFVKPLVDAVKSV